MVTTGRAHCIYIYAIMVTTGRAHCIYIYILYDSIMHPEAIVIPFTKTGQSRREGR